MVVTTAQMVMHLMLHSVIVLNAHSRQTRLTLDAKSVVLKLQGLLLYVHSVMILKGMCSCEGDSVYEQRDVQTCQTMDYALTVWTITIYCMASVCSVTSVARHAWMTLCVSLVILVTSIRPTSMMLIVLLVQLDVRVVPHLLYVQVANKPSIWQLLIVQPVDPIV